VLTFHNTVFIYKFVYKLISERQSKLAYHMYIFHKASCLIFMQTLATCYTSYNSPVWQWLPWYPGGHVHVYPATWSVHTPPWRHGLELHSTMSTTPRRFALSLTFNVEWHGCINSKFVILFLYVLIFYAMLLHILCWNKSNNVYGALFYRHC